MAATESDSQDVLLPDDAPESVRKPPKRKLGRPRKVVPSVAPKGPDVPPPAARREPKPIDDVIAAPRQLADPGTADGILPGSGAVGDLQGAENSVQAGPSRARFPHMVWG